MCCDHPTLTANTSTGTVAISRLDALEGWVSPDASSTDSSATHSKSRSDRNPGCEVIPVLNGEIQAGERNHNQRLEELTETTKRAKFVADRTVDLNFAESFLLSLAAQFISAKFWGNSFKMRLLWC